MSAQPNTSPAPQPFIKTLHAENFRCLRDVTVDFAPLTILVGPNASGKSTILEALQHRYIFAHEDRWQRSPDLHPRLHLLSSWGPNADINEISEPGGKLHWESQLIRLDARELRKPNQASNASRLSTYGENLTNLFASLSRRQQGELVKQFQRLVPALQDINDVPFQAGTLELRFTDAWNEALVYKPEEVSDGTMFVLAFLCLQYQSQPPDILLIEEPERGLHPYLMEQVMRLLRALAHGELGPKAVQVVMATHSAELLEYARPEEVRFVNRRREDGATTVYAPDVNSESWRDIFDVYENSMSGLWLSGTAGGVPGRS
jgi:predicted ATPase